jgi:putative acetyltransferase
MTITIRRADPEDYELVTRIFEDDSTTSGTLQTPFPSRERWKKLMAEPVDGDYLLLAFVDGEIAGLAGLHPTGRSPRRAHARMLSICVIGPYQGKGVSTKLMQALIDLADKWLPITRIELTVFSDNARAIRLYERFGFEREGIHKAYALRDGAYVDTLAMARVKAKMPGV